MPSIAANSFATRWKTAKWCDFLRLYQPAASGGAIGWSMSARIGGAPADRSLLSSTMHGSKSARPTRRPVRTIGSSVSEPQRRQVDGRRLRRGPG